MAGMTPEGFDTKSLNDIIKDLRAEAEVNFRDLTPDGEIVDTSDSTILGRLTKLVSPSLADLWEAAEDVYSSFDPDSATGKSLDAIVKYGRLERRQGQPSSALVRLLAQDSTTIPEGSGVKSVSGDSWELSRSISFQRNTKSNGVIVKLSEAAVDTPVRFNFNLDGVDFSAEYIVKDGDSAQDITNGLLTSLENYSETITPSLYSNTEISVIRKQDFNDTLWSYSGGVSTTGIYLTTTITSRENGKIAADAGEINQIETPVLGWMSVTNPYDAVLGSLKETDQELRNRFKESKYERAVSIFESVYTSVLNVDGVRDVTLYENDTGAEDEYGIPAHSFSVVVSGGDDKEIGQAIWNTKPLGIAPYGNTEVDVIAIDGRPYKSRLERPSNIPIKIEVEVVPEYNFPDNGAELIKSSILTYFRETYRMGEDVNYSKLFTPINKVRGHYVNLLQFGKKGGELGYNPVKVKYNEVAVISYDDISVNITQE